MKWKCNPNGNEDNNIMNDIGKDLKDSNSKGDKGEQKEIDNKAVRTSKRVKKTPINRSDGFLWIMG